MNTLTRQSRTLAERVFAISLNTAEIFWTAEVYSDEVAYETNAKVFIFADGSRLRVDATSDRAEVLS